MQVWIGTSGYAYPEWVGGFYPRGTSSAKMLPYYARRFPLVELNYTFYRPPTAEDLKRLADRTPAGFQFIVKLHQSLTHEHELKGAESFRRAVEALRAEGKLMGLLAQFPQRFHEGSREREQLAELAKRFEGLNLAVEFRHRSWHRPDLPEWLRERGLDLVSVDAPAIPALYPSGLVWSQRVFYVRWHSRRASSWYESDKDRYDYLYSDAELGEWLTALSANASAADRALLLFNNCRTSQAAENAERIRQLLGTLGPDFQVVPPFAELDNEVRQPGLFEG